MRRVFIGVEVDLDALENLEDLSTILEPRGTALVDHLSNPPPAKVSAACQVVL
jgi:hypothetical protein